MKDTPSQNILWSIYFHRCNLIVYGSSFMLWDSIEVMKSS